MLDSTPPPTTNSPPSVPLYELRPWLRTRVCLLCVCDPSEHSISFSDVIIGGDAVTRSASPFVSASTLRHVTSCTQGKEPFLFLVLLSISYCVCLQ